MYKMFFALLTVFLISGCQGDQSSLVEAIELSRSGELKESQAKYEELLEKNPDNPLLLNNYGWVLANQKKITQAKDAYSKALVFDDGRYDLVINKNLEKLSLDI